MPLCQQSFSTFLASLHFGRKTLRRRLLFPLNLCAVPIEKTTLSAFAPAKINLSLAVTGRRPDGFHELISLVAPISLGDTLTATPAEADSLACSEPEVPNDASNLVMKATLRFRDRVPSCPPIAWELTKCVPHGAGLGGGSSDAATALKILNRLCGNPLDAGKLYALGAELGSDVPLFLAGNPVIMRGRGERIETLPARATAHLLARRFLIFKPAFGVSTAEAYAAMKRNAPHDYVSEATAEASIRTWLEAPEKLPLPLFNNMERAVFRKHLALPALFEKLRNTHNLDPHMSGSGSACFAETAEATDLPAVTQSIRDAWGESAFIRTVTIVGAGTE